MGTINITLQGKGGVGKSYVASLLAQHISGRDVSGSVVIDEDIAVAGFEGVNDKRKKIETSALPDGSIAEAINGLKETNPTTKGKDFVEEATFDPNALRGWGKYKLWGSEELKPETVFRDDQFTYIKFGDKWKNIELPTAYVVVDKIDELVNTRIQGQTFIVESTRKLITLKSGKSFLCIEYPGDKG